MQNQQTLTIDGNQAAATVAHKLNEVIAIYPITPSSNMGEWADEWSSRGQVNLWGTVPQVTEMQSEAGAAGAIHGALQAGSMATTFTASQGLLLMLPNMYKIAGELTPTVFHIAARSLACQGLSIFGDHSDVMSARMTGFGMLCSNSPQEVMDMALIAHAVALESRIPLMHFFDGFRTSHEVAKISTLDDDVLRSMINEEWVTAHRNRALTPDKPVLRGTAQNPDVYFQARETVNAYYEAMPGIVQRAMDKFAALTGRSYRLFDYQGSPEAERVVVMMGSGAEAVAETLDYLNRQGESVGLLKVRLYRPFDAKSLIAAIPPSCKKIAVLDRTKEPGADGEPLYKDVLGALAQDFISGESKFTELPKIVGGRYGLSSKEFTPGMIKAIFDELKQAHPKNNFTIGIHDDVTHTSLDWDASYRTDALAETFQAMFYGLGSDGTVSANKNTIKIIGEATEQFAQGYFVYDSKKSGAITVSHLRFGPNPIRSTYLIGENDANFIGCHQTIFLERYDMLVNAAENAVFLLNTPEPVEQVWESLPAKMQQQMIELWSFEAREFQKALEHGRKILAQDPNNVVIRNVLSAVYAQTGQYNEALEQIEKIREIQPDAPNLDVTLGVIYLGQREFDKAIEAAERAKASQPDNPVPYDTLGRAYTAKKEYENAEGFFVTALEKRSDYLPAIVGLGNLYGIQRNYYKALEQYQKAIAVESDSPEAHTGLAGVYRMTGNTEHAFDEFETVLRLQPQSPIALFNAADLAVQLGKYEKAIEYAGTLVQRDANNVNAKYILAQAYSAKADSGNAMMELQDIVRRQNTFQPAVLDLGLTYLIEEDFDQAKQQFDQVLTLNEKQTAAMLGAAIAAQNIGNDAEAVTYAEQALAVQPENPMNQYVLGNIYISQNSYEKAREAFSKAGAFYEDLPFDDAAIAQYYGENPGSAAMTINLATTFLARGWDQQAINLLTDMTLPKNVREGALARYALARAYTMQENYDKALQELDAVVAAHPDLAVVYKNQGNIYQSKKESAQAVEAYKKFLEANPDDAATQVQLGLAYEGAGMVDEAITEYQKILEAMPDSALTKNQLAWLYADKGENLDEAIKLALEAEQARPAAGIIDTVGWVYYQREEFDKAVEKFQHALELSPLQPTIRYHLGLAYSKQGQKDLAIHELENALHISEDFREVNEAKTLLEELKKQ